MAITCEYERPYPGPEKDNAIAGGMPEDMFEGGSAMEQVNSTSFLRPVSVAALMVVALFVGTGTGQDMTDPHDILGKYFEASGGLERLKGERTRYFEGDFSMAGMQGSITAWEPIAPLEPGLGPGK